MFKTNKGLSKIVNSSVVEWDIRAANVSLMEYYALAPQSTIAKIRAQDKSQREITVGKLQGKVKGFAKALEDSFNKIIEEFIQANGLEYDSDIVSIKRDAVFVKDKQITQDTFGPVTFVPKNSYQHVLLIPGYEFYVSTEKTDVKGVSDLVLDNHTDGMLDFIRSVVFTWHDTPQLYRYMKQYCDAYKKKDLDFDAYRRFDSESCFDVLMGGDNMRMAEIDEEDMPFLDISFNYENVIIPTLQMVI
ncbi:MAG: hypothetical protein NC548_06405 [Lachnospiraceae bacterium]|nr:hypothetical protein [Lachnospiraceae bacterium]